MSINLVLPKNDVAIGPKKKVFFLGGPVLGGGDWQRKAIGLFFQKISDAYVVCPVRYEPNDSLQCLSLPGGELDFGPNAIGGVSVFPRQTHWERYYLNIASKQGAILFWLPEEDQKNPRPPENGPYARDTYGELGEWRVRMHRDKAHVVIGAQRGFPGISVIEANYRAVLGDMFITEPTIEETVAAAIALADR